MSRYFLFENNNSLEKTNPNQKDIVVVNVTLYYISCNATDAAVLLIKILFDKFFPNEMMMAALCTKYY